MMLLDGLPWLAQPCRVLVVCMFVGFGSTPILVGARDAQIVMLAPCMLYVFEAIEEEARQVSALDLPGLNPTDLAEGGVVTIRDLPNAVHFTVICILSMSTGPFYGLTFQEGVFCFPAAVVVAGLRGGPGALHLLRVQPGPGRLPVWTLQVYQFGLNDLLFASGLSCQSHSKDCSPLPLHARWSP